MSDTPQGPDWWRASDGRWYPPEAKPGPRPATPPGVPGRPPADPKVQEPFTPRRVEPLELERDRDRGRRRIPWGWVGVVFLVLLFGGAGTWLALTADRGGDTPTPSPTTAPATSDPTDTTSTTAAESTTTTGGETSTVVSVFDLSVGDCFDAAPDDSDADEVVVISVELIDCDEPHLAEVIGATRFRDEPGEPFPGIADRDTEARTFCQEEFETYVGVPIAASDLGLLWLAPTQQSWEEEDDREIACAVQSLDGEPLVGSVAGTGR